MTQIKTVCVEKEVYEAVLRNSVRVNDLETENHKLKELLKECKETIETSVWGNCSELTDQIDEVLK